MKSSRANGMKYVTKSVNRNQKLKILLCMYAKDIHMARLILDSNHIDSSEVSLELRSSASIMHLRRAINKLRSLGFEDSHSYGHLIYIKTMDALLELEGPVSELSFRKCLRQLDRRICQGYNGDLIYYDRFTPLKGCIDKQVLGTLK